MANLGTFDAINGGMITSVNMMYDQPGTDEALEFVKKMPWLSVGWSMHFWGSPVLPPEKVPSLVVHDGEFKGRFRDDVMNLKDVKVDEAAAELRAEIHKCLDFLGKAPAYNSINFKKSPWGEATRIVCEEYSIPSNILYNYEGSKITQEPDEKWKSRKICVMHSGGRSDPAANAERRKNVDSLTWLDEHYDPVQDFYDDKANILKLPIDSIAEVSLHPAYMDSYLLLKCEREGWPGHAFNRFMTVTRMMDVEALRSPRLRQWIIANRIELVSFTDALFGTNDFQNHLLYVGSDLAADHFD